MNRPASALALALAAGCGGSDVTNTGTTIDRAPAVAELGGSNRRFTQIGGPADGLAEPRDIAFHATRPNELWTVNRAFEGTVTFNETGTSAQRSVAVRNVLGGMSMNAAGTAPEKKMDGQRSHFMQQVIAIAMGANGTFATCHEGFQQFMGPTLWDSNPAIYAQPQQAGWGPLGSHIDMLHQTPLCLGLDHERDNVFWISDGTHGAIARYDFRADHGPGHDDHSDGQVRLYTDAKVTRVAGVPGHVVYHDGWLYYADPGGKRIVRLKTTSGAVSGALQPFVEPIEYDEVRGATVEVVVSTGLSRPSGLALRGDRLFVTDNATSEIIAFDLSGRELQRVKTPAISIMGITVGPEGRLWYVDAKASTVVRIDP